MLGPTTIQVTWQGPKVRLKEIRHYKLTWENLDLPTGEAFRPAGQRKIVANYAESPVQLYTATISDLLPTTSYQVAVAAANERGIGERYLYPVVRTKRLSEWMLRVCKMI